MPIHLAPIPANPLLCGYIWQLKSEDELARLVGRVLLGHYLHVEKILARLNPRSAPVEAAAAEAAKALLVVNSDQDPWHRDGLLFQQISWVAAHLAAAPTRSVFSVPHLIPAQKGFDGVQIDLDDQGKLLAIVIFEDKATVNPRTTIRDEVWPAIRLLEAGKRQNEVMQETTALLQRASVNEPDQVIEGIIWKSLRRFRVSITGGTGHDSHPGIGELFKDYDTVAPGSDSVKRRAEVICFENLRPWMQQFAGKVITAIDSERSQSHV